MSWFSKLFESKEKRKNRLKEEAMQLAYMVRKGDASYETNYRAALALIQAVDAGVEIDWSDPAFQFFLSRDGQEAMIAARDSYGERGVRIKSLFGALAGIGAAIAGVSAFMVAGPVAVALGTLGIVSAILGCVESIRAIFDNGKMKARGLKEWILKRIDEHRPPDGGSGGLDRNFILEGSFKKRGKHKGPWGFLPRFLFDNKDKPFVLPPVNRKAKRSKVTIQDRDGSKAA